MAQLAVVYRFMLRQWQEPSAAFRQLGSIDDAGTALYSIASNLLRSIYQETQVDGLVDPQPQVTFNTIVNVSRYHRAAALLCHYQYGSRGTLNRYAEGDLTPFDEIDNQQTDVAIVLSAPPLNTVGFIGLQVPNGRGIKAAVEPAIRRFFREQYELHLTLEPVVPLGAVAQAIEHTGVGFISFRKLTNPTDIFADDSEKWTVNSEFAKVELKLSPQRSGRLPARRLARFVRSQTETDGGNEDPITFDELATIQGQTYDELSVEILLDGRKKVMRIDRNSHWMSHAFSWELSLGARYGPADIVAAIAELLPE